LERLIYLGGHMTTAITKYRAAIDEKELPTTDDS
jgi:hypothetical protein